VATPHFLAVIGDPGSFKTCFITYQLALAHGQGQRTISNYHTTFSEYIPFEDQVKDISRLKNAVIGWDELAVGADSYDFFMAQPRKMATIVAEVRKIHSLLWYSAQAFGRIASRLRASTGGFFLTEDLDAKINPGPRHRETCKGQGRISVLDANYTLIRRFGFNAIPTYALFDTDEIIESKG